MQGEHQGRALLIGPGKVNMGVVAPLLQDYFRVCFVFRPGKIADENERQELEALLKGYEVIFVSHYDGTLRTVNVLRDVSWRPAVFTQGHLDGILFNDETKVVVISVQPTDLPGVAAGLIPGLRKRYIHGRKGLAVLVVSNVVGSAEKVEKVVREAFPTWEALRDAVECVDVCLDCIVPSQETPRAEIIREEHAYVAIPKTRATVALFRTVKGVVLVDDFEAMQLTKIVGVNGLHFTLANVGKAAGLQFLLEAMGQPAINAYLHGPLLAELVIALTRLISWPEEEIRKFLTHTIDRFANPRLTDTCDRILHGALQKVGRHERLVLPLCQFKKHEHPHALITALAAAFWNLGFLEEGGGREELHETVARSCGLTQFEERWMVEEVVSVLLRIREVGILGVL